MVGSGDIDLAITDGELPYPMVIKSADSVSGMLAEVRFPGEIKVKDVAGNKNTEKLRAPKFKNPQSYQNSLGKLGISAIDV